MQTRIHQFVLIVALAWSSWLAMMLVHETGHMLGAWATGGHVQRLIWHPLAFSRTDVQPNPVPLVVVWCGPLFGSTFPLFVLLLANLFRPRVAYMFGFFCGFCLLANGLYIGLGIVDPVGDARDMLRLGTPAWVLAIFGTLAASSGLWLWHRISPRLGFGPLPAPIVRREVYGVLIAAIMLSLIGFVIGNRGL